MSIDQLVIFLLSICIVLVVLWLLWKLVNWLVAPLQAGQAGGQIGKISTPVLGSGQRSLETTTTNLGGRQQNIGKKNKTHQKKPLITVTGGRGHNTNRGKKPQPPFGSSTPTHRIPTK